MYLKNIIVIYEGGGTVYLDMERINLWDCVSKVITCVEFCEKGGNSICSRMTTIIYFHGTLCTKKAVS
jgi:hypothetical protein